MPPVDSPDGLDPTKPVDAATPPLVPPPSAGGSALSLSGSSPPVSIPPGGAAHAGSSQAEAEAAPEEAGSGEGGNGEDGEQDAGRDSAGLRSGDGGSGGVRGGGMASAAAWLRGSGRVARAALQRCAAVLPFKNGGFLRAHGGSCLRSFECVNTCPCKARPSLCQKRKAAAEAVF